MSQELGQQGYSKLLEAMLEELGFFTEPPLGFTIRPWSWRGFHLPWACLKNGNVFCGRIVINRMRFRRSPEIFRSQSHREEEKIYCRKNAVEDDS